MRYILILLLALTTLLSCGRNKREESVSDCNGKDYCHIYRVSATTNGDIDTDNDGNGIEEADVSCIASKPSDTGNVKAMIVDGTNREACTTANCGGGIGEHKDWVLSINTEYRRPGGGTVIGTTNGVGIFTFNLLSSFYSAAGIAFTGLSTDYTTSNDCTDWTSTGGNGQTGLLNATNNTAISNVTAACTNTYYLICVEQ